MLPSVIGGADGASSIHVLDVDRPKAPLRPVPLERANMIALHTVKHHEGGGVLGDLEDGELTIAWHFVNETNCR